MVKVKLQVCGHFGYPYQLKTSSMNRLKSAVNEVDMTCFNYPSLKAMVSYHVRAYDFSFKIQSLLGFSHCSQNWVFVFLNPDFKRHNSPIKILSSFTRPHIIQNLRDYFLCGTQRKIFGLANPLIKELFSKGILKRIFREMIGVTEAVHTEHIFAFH